MPVKADDGEFEVERFSEQEFLPRVYDRDQVLIYPNEKEFLSGYAVATKILFSAYNSVPIVRLSCVGRKGSMSERLEELKNLGWKTLNWGKI